MKKLLLILALGSLAWAQTIDSNGDGRIDEAEWKAASAQLRAKYDTNGDGQLDEAEKQAATQAIRARLDANGDGKIDRNELQNARANRRNRPQ